LTIKARVHGWGREAGLEVAFVCCKEIWKGGNLYNYSGSRMKFMSKHNYQEQSKFLGQNCRKNRWKRLNVAWKRENGIMKSLLNGRVWNGLTALRRI
jgi:hypothetical protein